MHAISLVYIYCARCVQWKLKGEASRYILIYLMRIVFV